MDSKDLRLIKEETESWDMKPMRLKKPLIDELFNKYNSCNMSELYYDNEINDDSRDMYMSPNSTDEEWEDFKANFDPREHHCWTEPLEEGNYGFTRQYVNKKVRHELNNLKTLIHKNENGRCYTGKKADMTAIYFYGRDLDIQMDYWFKFYNDKVDICSTCRKRKCWRRNICGEKFI